MAPLITREEALELGELSAPADIEALVERAWQARTERFADSTDMCSLVNAKSGGCAQDCGFCAQSRYAEAETPLHAMMEPEQILEHARACLLYTSDAADDLTRVDLGGRRIIKKKKKKKKKKK